MKPLYYTLTCIVLFAVLTAGCNTKSMTKCGPCPEIAEVLPNINFNIVDKKTGKDLFWGTAAPYKLKDLKMHHIINGHPDTAYIRVDSANMHFNIFVMPTHAVDTVTMQVADKPQDILLFHTGTTGGCCPFLILNSVLFNGVVVYTHEAGGNVVLLGK